MTDSHFNTFFGGVFPGAGSPTELNLGDKHPGRGRRRRDRTNFSSSTIQVFESVFATERYPDIYLREQMSKKTGVPEERILVWFQNKRNRTKKVPAPGEQSVKRPWEDDEGERRDCKRSRRSSSSSSAVQRCLRMGISHEEIDSMCVMDNSAFSEDEGEIDVVSVTPPKPEVKKETENQIGFRPYKISPKRKQRVESVNALPTIPPVPFNPFFGLLPNPALLPAFTTGMSPMQVGNPFAHALLHRLMLNNTAQPPAFQFPSGLGKLPVLDKPATTTSNSKPQSPPPAVQSLPSPLDLSASSCKVGNPRSKTFSISSPIMVEPRLSPCRSSSGASSPDSGVSSGNVSRFNDSTPLDLSSSYS